MDLKMNLISCYTLSVDLGLAKMKWLEHKNTASIIKKSKKEDLEAIQKKIDKYLSAAVAMESIARLEKQQKKLERRTVAVLKKIKFPQEKVIKFFDQRHGKLRFWYKGGRILSLKEDSDLLVSPAVDE